MFKVIHIPSGTTTRNGEFATRQAAERRLARIAQRARDEKWPAHWIREYQIIPA